MPKNTPISKKARPEAKGIIFDLQGTLVAGSYDITGNLNNITLRRGLYKALGWLTDNNVKIGVVTNYEETRAISILESIDVLDYINPLHVIAGGSIRQKQVLQTERHLAKGWRGLMGIRHDVEATVTKNTTINDKPDPEPVRYLLYDWQIQPKQAVYIGDDSYLDQMCATGAGVRFKEIPALNPFDNNLDLLEFMQGHV